MVAKPAESVAEQNRNYLIVPSQNSATDSVVQKESFTVYCRIFQNGIGLIHEPGGISKTLMVAKLAESTAEQNRKCLRRFRRLQGGLGGEFLLRRQRCSERMLYRVLSHFGEWDRTHPRTMWHREDPSGSKTCGKYRRIESQLPHRHQSDQHLRQCNNKACGFSVHGRPGAFTWLGANEFTGVRCQR